ncbi:MAG TPA: hypothetical protein VFM98_11030 [Ramlibacter sp.]|uniref:hypothetical protein n=1 Tax=Ramlibacter sp. TaxID=1917967 RepID=UPI002D7F6CFC|nr:hypothetical protein [Ramlibacter sp.]HET8746129.1 hypothetical protein [Ramlibacter sp.]
MRLRWFALVVAVFAAPIASAQTAAAIAQQMQRVEGALNRLSQEQLVVYQQFQMVQEMRRSEERLALQRLPIYRLSTLVPPPSVDDIQRDEDARTQRMNELQAESDRLYARYRELEEEKRPLLDTLSTLAQATPEPAGAEVQAGAVAVPVPVPTPVPPVTQPSPGFTGTFPGFTGGSPGFTPAPVPPPPPATPSR